MESTTVLVAAVVAVAVLGVVWFAVRFWLASTRPADIKVVDTPNLDRLNRAALEGAVVDEDEEDEEEEDETANDDDDENADEEAPKGLKDVVPEEKKP